MEILLPSTVKRQSLCLYEMGNDEHIGDAVYFLDSSDDESECKIVGPVPGRAANIERGREQAAKRLYDEYFSANPVYTSTHFVRRFRVSLEIFQRVQQALEAHEPYFTQHTDCTGRRGLSSYQKITAALRMLASGSAADSIDEYVRLGESTALECLERFCEGFMACFGTEYFRSTTRKIWRRY